MPKFELFGTKGCPYTQDMREWLDWKGYDYQEYDVELDSCRPRQNDRPLRRPTHRAHARRRRRCSPNRLAGPRLRSECLAPDAPPIPSPMLTARNIRVRGIVQGVGFRPFVFRLAQANTLSGWVFNDADGVEIHLEGPHQSLDAFVESLRTEAPQAAQIATIHIQSAEPSGLHNFEIRHSEHTGAPTTRISPDLPVCADCLAELFDPTDPPLQLSLYQLHQLRPALFRNSRTPLRSRQHDDEKLAAR